MNEAVISVSGLGKRYALRSRQKYRTFRESLVGRIGAPMRQVRSALRSSGGKAAQKASHMWALHDVFFDVQPGEVVGVIGKNGAGKSTLLKILSRITHPTLGFADIRGRVGSLLEVGTGFHQELTGRENVFLNGAILGMHKAEIRAKFDEIVAFSEIDRYIDTPVKHYSSGMQLRLAFAVAAHLEPEILLMDEVLAVGDAAFQKKCLGKMNSVAVRGRTVLFVSHNMIAVRELCTRAIWIHDGGILADGDVDEVVGTYLRELSASGFEFYNPELDFRVEHVRVGSHNGDECSQFRPGDDLVVTLRFDANSAIRRPHVLLLIEGAMGRCFTANMMLDGCCPEVIRGSGELSCRFREIPLLPQTYSIKMAIRGADGRQQIMPLQDVASFDVGGRLEEFGFCGEFQSKAAHSTSVVVPYEWTLPDRSRHSMELKPTRILR